MSVRVQFHRTVQEAMDAWREGDDADENRVALVDEYIDVMKKTLADTLGQAPGARLMEGGSERWYRWRFSDELTVEYVIRIVWVSFLDPWQVRIIITRLRLDFGT